MFLLAFVLDFAAIALLLLFLLKLDHGAKASASDIAIIFAMSVPAVVIASIVEPLVIPNFNPTTDLLGLVTFLVVGIVEESMKSIPVLILIWKRRYFRDYTGGIIYFALSGQAFSLLEDLGYLVGHGGKVGVFRILLDPFFHATTCAVFGFTVAHCKLGKGKPWLLVGGFSTAVLMHCMYDFLVSSPSKPVIVLGLLFGFSSYAMIIALYFQARRLDERLGLAWKRKNNFCRSCGAANPRHLLFCTACGTKYQ